MIAFLPIGTAFAGESVLEIPPASGAPSAAPPYASSAGPPAYAGADAYGAAPDADPNATSGATAPAEPPSTVAANTESYPPDPNLGSIDDYQNQPGENGRQQSAGIYFGGGSRRNEPQGSMTTNLIVGGLFVGLVALEIASHHHHR